MTSNGGALLLRQADRMLGLMAAAERARPTSTRRSMPPASSSCWSFACARCGRRRASPCGRTRASAAAGLFEGSGVKQHRFTDLSYGAKSWNRERRVIARLEHGSKGANPRFVPHPATFMKYPG